jgi:hypothetical protein
LPFVNYHDLIKSKEKDLNHGKRLIHSVDAENTVK